uniref:Uncharacterized protein LOC105056119 n=1 Tax=Elaeis guineensis var. tenera TaxID=51953 RepID=A0A6I9S3C1_ELAGV|nr:uncharacterized protein LOC105056119 [Elaeis guineensis]
MAFEIRGVLMEWKRTLITLILKRSDISIPKHFRPISLCTILYKEFMHHLQRAPYRHSLMVIKLDMEQTYDRMSWSFLRRMLQELGFKERWIGWTIDCIEASSFTILVNGTPTEFFYSFVGLHQGQLVNIQKSTVIFSPRMKPQVQLAIEKCLGIRKQTGMLTYLGVSITSHHLRRAECRPLKQQIQENLQGL